MTSVLVSRDDELKFDSASLEHWSRMPCEYCGDYVGSIPFQVPLHFALAPAYFALAHLHYSFSIDSVDRTVDCDSDFVSKKH